MFDEEQNVFGLLEVAHDLAEIKVINEGKIDEYYHQIDALISGKFFHAPGISFQRIKSKNVFENPLYICLQTLEESDHPLSCKDLEQKLSPNGLNINTRKIKAIIKKFPVFFENYFFKDSKAYYKISRIGRLYVKLVKRFI